ncbi:unnamed protein product [Ranitomeya imitator]|uniref:Cytochrome P450 n=1 Tax=Ranitomeya imitator TaxID=111125 RepID=A0ABN9KY30_9NEOB|nr:unnamed protein product [Ranitomeya imitator]
MTRHLFHGALHLSEKYGEVFTLHFGPKKMVILAGYKIIKEALVTRAEDFGERPTTPLFDIVSRGHGIILSNGETWKSMRRFTLSTLRDFGMGKKSVEARIQDELMPLIESFSSHNARGLTQKLQLQSAAIVTTTPNMKPKEDAGESKKRRVFAGRSNGGLHWMKKKDLNYRCHRVRKLLVSTVDDMIKQMIECGE